MYGFEVKTPRQDSWYGMYLEGNGKGEFYPVSSSISGLYVNGNVADANFMTLFNGKISICITRNNDSIRLIETNMTNVLEQIKNKL